MPAEPVPEPPPMRQRYRAQVRGEVKQAALRQLAQSGPAGLSVSAIGKELGVSGPALYRYFASRDELLTELVIDAYHDLAEALRDAASQAASREPLARLEVLARAYRSWAVAQPHRYRLLFGPPLPGYDAHTNRLVDPGQAAMNLLLDVLRELGQSTAPPPPQPLASQLSAWARPPPRDRPHGRPARCACLEPPARPGEPGNRRELRVHGHRPQRGLRDTAGRAYSEHAPHQPRPRTSGDRHREAWSLPESGSSPSAARWAAGPGERPRLRLRQASSAWRPWRPPAAGHRSAAAARRSAPAGSAVRLNRRR